MQPFLTENPNPQFHASAPGRMDVMGGIADYSGSLVLQMPIQEQTSITLALREDDLVRIRTHAGDEKNPFVQIPLAQLLRDGKVDYAFVREQMSQIPGGDWAGYVVGCLMVLQKERGIDIIGADIQVESQVPVGKGVSSSAALEVATMKALAQAYQLTFEGTELPRLAQKVENQVVGAPCGLMDQLACYFGQSHKLLPILCQPDHVSTPFAIPEGVHFVGIDSGVRHAVGGASYGDVRTAAFMGYSIMAQFDGTSPGELARARQTGNWEELLYGGYLANIEPSEFEARYAALLPRQLSGADFLSRYQTTTDPFTEVLPDRMYDVFTCTRHPIYEHTRNQYFSLMLQHLPGSSDPARRERCLRQLGEWMFQSHESYSACGLGNPRTDDLIWMVRKNTRNGVYGARITGGGSGGTVCLLCEGEKGLQTAHQIHQQYQDKYGQSVRFFG